MTVTTQTQRATNSGETLRFRRYEPLVKLVPEWDGNVRWPIQIKQKRRSIMNLFKRESRAMQREAEIDNKFGQLTRDIEHLNEKIQILQILNGKEHVFIFSESSNYINIKEAGGYVTSDKAREWYRKKGYLYMETFKSHGELWIKEDVKEEKK